MIQNRHLHAPSVMLIAVLLAIAPIKAHAADTNGQTNTQNMTTGTVKDERKKRLDDCMALWDRDTHMTKRQWRRTCKRQLEEIKNL